ncbi:RNA-binding region-containing protein 3 [Exaiptasia diaphana]|uniref:RNA-binding region-containing protein 3 n=1 Tax=Exaiptasia diaphana TaxID=2652724 RepID=A0A913XPB2_EXADI|nr:RNA-binding region-containing protein 3 [Exaiptasia diaphana]
MASNQEGKCKLFVRHLPSILSNDDKIDLLKHFGAVEVVCMGRSSKMKDSAFADFKDETSAVKALNRLHQLEVLGSRLVVEYAKKSHERLAAQNSHRMSPSRDKEDVFDDGIQFDRKDEADIQDKNGQAKKETLDGIAPKIGIKYKSNPNLRYLYPPPNTAILTNIAHTLACVPKFYVQVLHLMNRMNLPAPFGPVTPTPPSIGERHTNDNRISSEESEMESDEEDKEKRARLNTLQKKSKPELQSTKRVKLKPTKGPLPKKQKTSSSIKQESVEEAFEQTAHQLRKIEFNLNDAITSIFDAGPPQMEIPNDSVAKGSSVVEGFGKFEPQPDVPLDEHVDDATNMEESDDFITLKELEANRMSQKELNTTSALKNYSVGEVTSRLYVKNLAKQVEEKDLQYIFGRYVDFSSEEEKDRFDIRHMKEGRMKGQAFITLPSESKAKRALKDVHGYILHGKPMVIQFARSAKAKETS